jgi:hypothetical protein
MVALVSGALLTGLLSSPHCLLMCGPLAAMSTNRPGGVWAWSAGRLGMYAVLGAAAGSLAGFVGRQAVLAGVVAAIAVAASAGSLAGWWNLPALVPSRLSRYAHGVGRGHPLGNLLLGAVSGLLPCGVVWGGLALATTAGGGLAGALVMSALAVSTVPAFAIAGEGVRRLLGGGRTARLAAAAVVLMSGWGTVGWRVIGTLGQDEPVPPCHQRAEPEPG